MPTLETPPNPVETTPLPEEPRVAAGRYGALDHSEIVRLLSTLDDEVARSRFRESIYLSLIICLALAWLAAYGPRVLFHGGQIVNVAEQKRDKRDLTYLELPPSLERKPPKPTRMIADQNHTAQTPTPTPKPPTPEQLQARQRAGKPAPPARPLPATPQPQPQQQPTQQAVQPKPQPVQPQQPPPRPTQQANNNIPDAPRPSNSTRPNFGTPTNPGDSIRSAADAAARDHGSGGEGGLNAPRLHPGLKSGTEILSDTQGVDFGPYMRRLHNMIQPSWEALIPQECYPPLNKNGTTVIRVTILPDGTIGPMHLDDSTRDIAIDKAAWGGITSQGQFPKLPEGFKGPLELRMTFVISHEGNSAR